MADATGAFFLRLPAMAAGGPYVLTATDGHTCAEATDIYIGEVWFAGGQSNMALPFAQLPEQWQTFKQLPPDPLLRMYTVPHAANMCKARDVKGAWQKADNFDVAINFSGVATWFAYRLRQELKVPVGIINSSFGASSLEAWISPNSLRQNPALAAQLRAMDDSLSTSLVWDKPELLTENHPHGPLLERFGHPDPGNTGVKNGWAQDEFDDSDWEEYIVPGAWTQQGLSGNGIFWARKRVQIPANWRGRELTLSMGGIDKSDITYFNGVEIGRMGGGFSEDYWNIPRKYTIPGELTQCAEAVIAVRMYSFVYDGGFNGLAQQYSLAPSDEPQNALPLAGSWLGKAEVDWGAIKEILPSGPGNRNTPGNLFDEMIRPLMPVAVRGIIFYQGENNAGNLATACAYEENIATLVRDWRFWFEQGDLPFYEVLLAPFRSPKDYQERSSWARVRESQRRLTQKLPQCDYAVISDVGDENNIHPNDKKTVGERLAALALHHDYQRADVQCHGPRPASLRALDNGAIALTWENADGCFSQGDAWKTGYYLAGDDQRYYPAECVEACGNTLTISSTRVRQPRYLRYLWADYPTGGFKNTAGIPAVQFELSVEANK
jgi:sialate O-acetylesterase